MTEKQNKTECFGTIDKYILFGGGLLLIFTAKRLKELGFQVFVVTSERHSKETRCIDSKTNTLLDWLDDDQIEYVVSQDITIDERVLSAISDVTIGLSFGAAWIFKQEFIEMKDDISSQYTKIIENVFKVNDEDLANSLQSVMEEEGNNGWLPDDIERQLIRSAVIVVYDLLKKSRQIN